jgi:cation:H+ antiporter
LKVESNHSIGPRTGSGWLWIALAAAVGLPSPILRLAGIHLEPVLASLIFGAGIVGGAFLLAWAREAAQVDISAGLAIAILAIIAILPEYAVEAVLAWNAGAVFAENPNAPQVSYVAANVTGANRLLIAFGWALVVLVFWLKRRGSTILPEGGLPLEITVLLIATCFIFLIAVIQAVPLWLSGILIAIYLWYLWLSSRGGAGEPHLTGPAATVGGMSVLPRRSTVLLLFTYSAAVILFSAEPFVEGLVDTGAELGFDEFLLIQWLAPLASESPEIVVACLFALQANPMVGIRTLISAGVNQMTVLIGTMPLVFSLSLGEAHAFPLDFRQAMEFLLTGALALTAVALLARMRLTVWHALALLAFFVIQLVFPSTQARLIASLVLFGVTVVILAVDPGRVKILFSMFKSVLPQSSTAPGS